MIGYKADGRRNMKVVYGATEAEATRLLRRALTGIEDGTVSTGRSPRLDAWMEHWVENIAAPELKPQTLENYRGKIRNYIKDSAVGRKALDKVTPEDLEALYAHMRRRGLSNSTVLQTHRNISRSLTIAVRRGRLAVNPATRMDAPSAATDFTPGVLPSAQARKLIRFARTWPTGTRWILALSMGLRQGEALGLAWDKVDLPGRRLSVARELYRLPWKHGCAEDGDPVCDRKRGANCPQRHGGGLRLDSPKSEAGARQLVLPSELVPLLEDLRDAQARWRVEDGVAATWKAPDGTVLDLVFGQRNGRPVDSGKDYRDWQALLAAAGLPGMRTHDARHTAATLLLELGVPGRVVMQMMGWSQASMLTRYQHVLDEMQTDAADLVGGALFAPETGDEAATGTDGVVSMEAFRRRRERG